MTVISGVFFARMLGAEQYGLYGYTISIITVLTLPVVAGFPNLIIREISKNHIKNRWGSISAIIRWSRLNSLLISTSIVLIFYLIDNYIFDFSGNNKYLYVAIVLVVIKGMVIHQSAILNGLSKPVLSQISVQLLLPVSTFFLALVIDHFYILNALSLIFATILSTTISLCFGTIFIKNEVGSRLKYERLYNIKNWYKALIPFSLISIVTTLNSEIGTVLLGIYSNNESVAFFRVALQSVALIILTISAMNTVLMPKISQNYNAGNISETQVLLTKSVRISAFTSIPIFIILVIFGENLISLFFGDEYLSAYQLIVILSIGQLVNVLSGSVATVLNMSGNEGKTLKKILLSLIINLACMLVFIPAYGNVGAAVSVTLGIIYWNLSLSKDVVKLTGLKAHIFCKL
ncbi:oligosaccharide flippase family protein [Vibrio splendidus]